MIRKLLPLLLALLLLSYSGLPGNQEKGEEIGRKKLNALAKIPYSELTVGTSRELYNSKGDKVERDESKVYELISKITLPLGPKNEKAIKVTVFWQQTARFKNSISFEATIPNPK
jgi:hypothetical protein